MKLLAPLLLSLALFLMGAESAGLEKFLFPPGFDAGKNLERVKRKKIESVPTLLGGK